MSHTHNWYEGGRVIPGENEELTKVEPARHPRTGVPFDFSDEADVAFARELGVDVDMVAPARTAKVIFDCACGETRHVPLKDGALEALLAMLASGEATVEDLGRMPVTDLIEEVPA